MRTSLLCPVCPCRIPYADVFAAPGNLVSLFVNTVYAKLCAESVISATRLHMRVMVDSLVGLCVSPVVHPRVPPKISDDGGVNRNLIPASVCRPITFAVAAG